MEKIELKPCPFCGGKAVFNTIKYTSQVDGVNIPSQHHEVFCSKCFVQTCSVMGGDANNVIDTWNRRVG